MQEQQQQLQQQQYVLPYVINPFTGLKTLVPGIVNPQIPPFTPNVVPPITPELIQHLKTTVKIEDVYHQPVVLIAKTHLAGEFDVYFLEQGLSGLLEHPQTRQVFQGIQNGQLNSAVVFHPHQLYNPSLFEQFEGFRVRNFQVLPELKVTTLLRGLTAEIPIVFLQETENLHVFHPEQLVKLGNFEITQENIQLPH